MQSAERERERVSTQRALRQNCDHEKLFKNEAVVFVVDAPWRGVVVVVFFFRGWTITSTGDRGI
jgi:hypothetical protein